MDIGTTIKRFRKRKDFTQETLAEKLGISKHTLAKYEQNQRQPNFEMLNTIASSLNMSPNALIAIANLAGAKCGTFWLYVDQIYRIYKKYPNNKRISNIIKKIDVTGELTIDEMKTIEDIIYEVFNEPKRQTFINSEGGKTLIAIKNNGVLSESEALLGLAKYIDYIANLEGYVMGSEYENIINSSEDMIRGKILILKSNRGTKI